MTTAEKSSHTPIEAELLAALKETLLVAESALSNYLGGDSLVRSLADLEPVRATILKAEGRS